MKLKEINRTAMQSWSPAQHHPIYLATGTSAQQLDASFSTNASLEFFELDLADPSLDMKSCGSYSSTHRYHKLVWGPHGMDDHSRLSGVLIAGGENGNVILYDPAKIMAGESDVIIAESDRHTGPVRALDINSFQTNLVASGGNESEIYIWDLNSFGSPMTPGPKTQPLEDISCVAWNRQVQHILASSSPSGRASVWDLRKNDLIIKVSDHSNRMHCSGLAWNPEVATQLVVSSEDDRMPVIQMWDLRFATSPLKVLEGHTQGILSIAWSLADPDLLLSCGKDNRILCWNPNTAEVLYELPTSTQWCFDIQWCPRNPAVLSAAGFDRHIDIYSIMGGSNHAQTQRRADQISTSFGNMDPFGTGQTLPPLQLPQTPAPPASVIPLKKPPKWLRRPVGATFAFGGKMVSLENAKPNPQPSQQPSSRAVYISQVVTEVDLLKRSDQLQATLSGGSFEAFCQEKISASENEFEKTIWSFLKANFENDVRNKFLELLGYNKEELALKISAALEEKASDSLKLEAVTPEAAFDMIAAANLEPAAGLELLPPLDFSVIPPAATPEAEFDLIAAANLEPAATLELQPPSDLSVIPSVATPEAAFDTIAAENLEPAATPELQPSVDLHAIPPEAAFDMIAAANIEAAATLELQTSPDLDVLPPAATPEMAFDTIAAANLEPAATPELQPSADHNIIPPEDAFDMIAAANLQPAATLELQPVPDLTVVPHAETPESAFDMIAAAAANLQPAATLELDSAAEAEIEKEEEVEALEEDLLLSDPEENMDQVELEEDAGFLEELEEAEVLEETEEPEKELVEEEIPLDEETSTPAEQEKGEQTSPADEVTPAPVSAEGVNLSITKDVDGLITQALLMGDFEGAVDLCFHDNRIADSIILAIAGGADLMEKTQKKYFTKTHCKITKLISAVVMKDWHDILKTCDLQNWKEALAAVMTYAQPEEFSPLCDLLGARLETAEVADLQAQACLCYICAGNVEKLVSCWSKAQDRNSPLSLQDLVEKVVVLRHAVEQTQRSGPAAVGVLLAEKLSQYANLLASQGNLSTAITYLSEDANQVAIQQLRERLSQALGQRVAAPVQTQRVQPQQPAHPAPPGPTTPLRHPFTPVQPTMVPQPTIAAPVPMPTPASAPAPAQPRFYQPVRVASTVTSWSNQCPTALPNVPPPPQVGNASDQQAEPPNSMYGLPASGSAAAPPASSTPAYMFSHQYQPYPQVHQYPPGAGGASLYPPPPPPSSSAAAVEPSSPPHPPGFLSHYTQPVPFQPVPLFYQPPISQGLSTSPPSHSPYFPNAAAAAAAAAASSSSSSSSSSFSAPPSSGATFQHGGPGSPVSYMPLLPPGGVSGPQNGWNDPPALSQRLPKKKQVLENYTPPAPITAPIMAPLGSADPQAQPVTSGPPQGMVQGLHGAHNPYAGMQQQHQPQQPLPPPGPMNPAMPKTSAEGAPGGPTGEVIQPLRSIPAEKISKKPIPDEHMVLKTTFEGLIQKCLAVATDPQTKRKLDDANKRLEALYDKLRDQTLSPAIVGGLHNIARTIESRSYTEGLHIHTHIVSSSNFSETSAFMPILKVVLTQANKLGV